MTLIEEHRARPAAASGWLVCLVVCLSCSCDGTDSGDGGSDADADTDGDTDADTDSDADSDSDTDTETETQPWTCEGEDVWEDPETGLCWMRENARKWWLDENDFSSYYMNWWDARDLCDSLEWSGYIDWRLPKIHELIGLVRGCPSADCPVHDPNCLGSNCNDTPDCEACEPWKGPGQDGCYWPSELGPDCTGSWSASTLASYSEIVWCQSLASTSLFKFNRNLGGSRVRCVRGEGTGTDGDADADTDTDTDTDTDADADADGDTDPGVVCDADCPDLVWVPIPGGTFPMGSDDGDPNEQPVHGVTVPSFDMTRSEVTVSQYAECVAASMCAQPGDYEEYDSWNWGVDGREDHPMHAVSWNDAAVFCAWVGGRLPSEAEWEYAARSGGQEITYPWGEAEPTCERAVMYEGTYGCGLGTYTMEVCSKPAGSTGQGLCDMAGNVWEWVRDWYHPNYDGAPEDGGAWEDQESDLRVARGGSYYSGAFNLRTSLRLGFGPSIVQFHLGFRCARDVD